MYESSFGLSDRPFAAAPSARRFFPAAAILSARQTLGRCVERAEGAGLVIGPAGSGKSLLCHVLAEQFRGRFLVALLASGRLETRRALLQAILFELGLPYRGMDEGELRLSLVDHLAAQETQNGGLLLLIDDAHGLPLRLLEEIHQLTNLVRNGQPRVRAVLAGSPALEEHLGSAKLESLSQRIAGRCYLQSFNHEETLGYVRQAIVQAGGDPDQIFSADALDAIHRASDGVPRLINQLCDHALLLACAAGAKRLTAAGIEEAWADLQQLPAPWTNTSGVEDRPADIIEFGSLDEPAVAARLSPDSEPRLRTVAADEENLFTGEPVQRIERIKDQLGAIDEQFQPAGTIGPEVELVFSNAEVNPFEEPFEEEEVIVDRFSAMSTDPLARASLVRSTEGAELSSLLAPHARTKRRQADAPAVGPKKELAVAQKPAAGHHAGPSAQYGEPPPAIDPRPPATLPPLVAPINHSFSTSSIESAVPIRADELPIDEPADSGVLPIARGWLRSSDDPVLPEEASGGGDSDRLSADLQPTIRLARSFSVGRANSAPARGMKEPDPVVRSDGGASDEASGMIEADSSQRVADGSAMEAGNSDNAAVDEIDVDDVDVIVVEDDPVPPAPPTTPSAVRRQEYRQLFARLRRG